MILNPDLLEQQRVSNKQQNSLIELYIELDNLLLNKDKLTPSLLVKSVEDIEFSLQENWNFTKDSNYHSYWYKIPGCTCPKMDNGEKVGTPYRVYSSDCPYHGQNIKEN